jgi:hydroxyacylglutathione hydrolase
VALEIASAALGQYQTNCYVLRASADVADAVVIDPGAQGADLIAGLERSGIVPVAILITHFHFDHLGAVADLAERYGCPVSICADEAHGLSDPDSVFPGAPVRPWQPDVLLAGDERFEIAGIPFETLRVPGHSPAHIAFRTGSDLFSGDVLFQGSVGRTDLPGASWEVLEQSIELLMAALPPATAVHPGHGPSTTLERELHANPFLDGVRARRAAAQEGGSA